MPTYIDIHDLPAGIITEETSPKLISPMCRFRESTASNTTSIG